MLWRQEGTKKEVRDCGDPGCPLRGQRKCWVATWLVFKEAYVTLDVGEDDLEERTLLVLAKVVQKLTEDGATLREGNIAFA